MRNCLLVCLVTLALLGCATEVSRLSLNEINDLSGNWNDTDSRLVSEEMIRDAMTKSWIENHTKKSGKPPVVIIGKVRNYSHEHINTRTFVADLERAFANSGRVEVVASVEERDGLREERKDMDIHATEMSRKAAGSEVAADYMLIGAINTIIDASGREQIRFYQVDLTLVSTDDNRKIWIGQKKLKKDVKGALIR
ncbi:MAG: penicillin-binding protein activator LpoB [Gallionellaceae bacterium]|nr:penicillin-binding protein activator LpoB [Gallionellaceae bacterium]